MVMVVVFTDIRPYDYSMSVTRLWDAEYPGMVVPSAYSPSNAAKE